MKTLLAAVLLVISVFSTPTVASAITDFERCRDPCIVDQNDGGFVEEFIRIHDLMVA